LAVIDRIAEGKDVPRLDYGKDYQVCRACEKPFRSHLLRVSGDVG